MARLPSIPALPTHGWAGMDASSEEFTPPVGGPELIVAASIWTATTNITAGGIEN